jgi:tyrosyl-tRNA synthetase
LSANPATKKDEKKKDAGKKEVAKNDGKQAAKSKNPAPVAAVQIMDAAHTTFYNAVRSIGEECITESELSALILKKVQTDKGRFILYDGFEPSGRMHCAQGVFKAMNVNKATNGPPLPCGSPSGGTFVFWVADWFALMNDKMGGDLDKIKVVGEYLIEVWTAAGMDMRNVEFKWASDEITNNANTYWPKMLDIASRFTTARIKKCCQIMGRLEGNLSGAQVLYPLMQCTDVFFLKADVCQLGVDQRKVNMLAREYCDLAKLKFKPVILSHHMLYGLMEGQEKMSKSNPDSAIFMEDTVEDVTRKINNAYCPTVAKAKPAAAAQPSDAPVDAGKESMSLIVDDLKNPCLDYIKYIVFGPPNAAFPTPARTYDNFEDCKVDFLEGKLKEADLKASLITAINALLEPVRKHFSTSAKAKDLFAKVQEYKSLDKNALDRKFRRCEAGFDCGLLVTALKPVNSPTLQTAVDLLAKLKSNNTGKQSVLLLSDWSALVLGCCDGDVKVMNAYYDVLVKSMRSLDEAAMASVKVVKQSEVILANPSDYWISVINVGRFFNLNVLQAGLSDEDGVGFVIERMMRVADCLAVSPAAVCGEEWEISRRYFDEASIPLPKPNAVEVSGDIDTNIKLQEVDEVHATENAEYFLMDDPKVHGKGKLKKSFCEPGNLTFCPAIALAGVFRFDRGGVIEVKRKDTDGGDITYNNKADISKDFASGALHPGDLKASVADIIVEVLTKLTGDAKKDKEWTNSAKCLKADAKKKNRK